MPGLIDTHIHAPQYKFTGTGYDKQLLQWLDSYTFPVEATFKDVLVAKTIYPKVVVSLVSKGLDIPGNFVACNSCNQVVTRVLQLCYKAATTSLQLLQATKLPCVWWP